MKSCATFHEVPPPASHLLYSCIFSLIVRVEIKIQVLSLTVFKRTVESNKFEFPFFVPPGFKPTLK